MRELAVISWREFTVLLRGLGPDAVTTLSLQSRGGGRYTGDEPITDPDAIDGTLRAFFGG